MILDQRKVTFDDYLSLCGVCKPWKQLIKQTGIHFQLASSPPWLMLPPTSKDDPDLRFFDVETGTIYRFINVPEPIRGGQCCGSSKGWLVIAKDQESIFLYNPVSRVHHRLPPVELLAEDCFDEQKSSYYAIRQHMGRIELSSSDIHSCTIAAIHARGTKLAICRLNDNTWTFLKESDELDLSSANPEDSDCDQHNFEDILFSEDGHELHVLCGMNNQTYSTVQQDTITLSDNAVINLKLIPNKRTLYWNRLRSMGSTNGFMSITPHLVKSNNGELLLVEKRTDTLSFDNESLPYHEANRAKVYKVDESSGEFTEVENLGDQALFVGRTGSTSFSWNELEDGERRNLIYFEENLGYFQYLLDSFIVPWIGEEEGVIPPVWFSADLSPLQCVLHWFSPSLH